jgi:opacity protein-like surface antigen
MKTLLIAAVAASITAGAAQAGSHNPAIKDPKVGETSVAAKGANSFTESQAKGRIEKAGYTNVSKLVKNPNGVWQGSASKDGQNVLIGLDYRGNVITR